MLSVSEFADAAGISAARARQLIAAGHLRGEKIGSQWAIIEGEVNRRAALPSRPMAERVAWAAAALADGQRADWLTSSERSRLRKRLSALRQSSDPVAQVQAWMRARGNVGWWRADAESLSAIARCVRVSGVASPDSRLSSGGLVEGYVRTDELQSLINEFWLVPADPPEAEVVLRVSDFAPDRVPRLMVAADLADHRRSREVDSAEQLVREVLDEGLW